MEKVIKWKSSENITDSELSSLWGYSKSMISRILSGERLPSPDKAKELVKISNGKLTLEDIYD